ncbi:TonB family protein [Jeongeupia chitinilytica]|uniref:TonB C-terminal domain-containing protein n=1 Tax=Jeongeupia chitinilytica TaxID=1041641 RepID=A0ABQ3GVN3_9NEIS|nr:TonB family protein [Jeongeupia chitinilytica]GHD57092.1 hypothetical protein GCM10007350_05250 [Jeongeupia chitinilytica]
MIRMLFATVLALGQMPVWADDSPQPMATMVQPRVPTRPEYPKTSREKGEEGLVQVLVNVRKDGSVEDTSIRLSSGFPALDASAQKYAASLRYVPAKLKSGESIGTKVIVPIDFKLNDNRDAFKLDKFADPDVLMIRIGKIYTGLGRDLGAAVLRQAAAAPRFIILDLRGNTGGTMYDAVVLASAFLPDGLTLATLKRSDKDAPVRLRSGSDFYKKFYKTPDPLAELPAYFKTVPVGVLVNQKTAWSAELVASALQHYQRATIVGSNTAGDASMLLGQFRVEWLDAGSRSIAGRGVVPDVPWHSLNIGEEMPDIAVVEAVSVYLERMSAPAASTD